MSYFNNHEIVLNYKLQNQAYNVMNITKRVLIPDVIKNDTNLFFYYEMKESDTLISMADKLYDDVNLHWIFLAFNDRYDLYNDWPLDHSSLNRYIERKYDDINAIHHYQSIATTAIVDADHADYDRLAVTNYEFEKKENNKKRNIKVVKLEHVALIRQIVK